MSRMTRFTVALLIAVSPDVLAASECYEPPKPPVKISGAFCGRLDDGGFGPTEVYVVDELGNRVAAVQTDSYGNFKFPALPKGKYRLIVPGSILRGEKFNSPMPKPGPARARSWCTSKSAENLVEPG